MISTKVLGAMVAGLVMATVTAVPSQAMVLDYAMTNDPSSSWSAYGYPRSDCTGTRRTVRPGYTIFGVRCFYIVTNGFYKWSTGSARINARIARRVGADFRVYT